MVSVNEGLFTSWLDPNFVLGEFGKNIEAGYMDSELSSLGKFTNAGSETR